VSPLDSNNPGVVVQKPKSDIYTTMLFLSFIAIVIACLCLWLEMRAYNMDIKANEGRVGVQSLESRVESLAALDVGFSARGAPALDSRL
jgi:hypothetical protein